MASTSRFEHIPQLNVQVNFARLPLVLNPKEIQVLSHINGMITLRELCAGLHVERLEMEQIITNLVKNDLILFSDPDQMAIWRGERPADDEPELGLPSETAEAEAEALDRAFERPEARAERGEWNLDSFFALLNRLSRERSTGVLRVFGEPGRYKAMMFERGELVNVSSVPFNPAECLGRLLQRAGRVNQEKVVKSLERSRSTGRRQGEELVAMGAIREDWLPEMLRVQAEVKLTEIMTWESGAFEWQSLSALPDHIARIPVSLPRVMFALVWKRYPFERIKRFLDERINMYVGRLDPPPYRIEAFEFGKPISRIYSSVLERDNLLKRLMIVANLKPEQTYRVIYGLYMTGMVGFFADTREDRSVVRIAELQQRLKRIEKESLFDVLGVHWTADDRQVEETYRRQRAAQLQVIESTEGLEKHMNQQLLNHLDQAYNVLKTSASRQAYRKEIYDTEFIIFGSDILRQKGESLLFTKEELDPAIAELRAAIEVYDRDSEYWAALGLALFMKHYPRQLKEAEEGRRMVRKALAMKPDSELNNLCMGMLYKVEKRGQQAIEQLEKVLKINPKNRFAALEIEEIKTGKRSEDYQMAVREFVERRAKADEDFDKKMEAKRKAAAEKKG